MVVPIVVPTCVALVIFFIGYWYFIRKTKIIGSTLQEETGNINSSLLAKLYVLDRVTLS